MIKKVLSSKLVKIFFVLLLGLLFLNIVFPLNKDLYNFKYSKIYFSYDNKPIRMKIAEDEYWRFYTTNEKVPKLLKESILVFEDRYFYEHFGVNIFSIFRAVFNNLFNSSRIGASTITMQVVKLVEPKKRTYFNKLIEIFRAIQLEINYSKDEILNMYFNKAPYGGNIEGLRAAAYFYFKKELKQLSISQMAILTTIPKNPNVNRPNRQKNLSKKKNIVLEKLLEKGLINSSEFKRAKNEEIVSIKQKAIFDVVQYTQTLPSTNKTDIFTTIDYEMQKFIQKYLKNETKKYNKNNLFNSAAIVIDNKTLDIKAYVASNDFYDKKNGGENDGIVMKKSPGSTLKPFVYALALDEGLITTKRNLLDIPFIFNEYSPKNYNKKFYGEISVEEALKLSLNIPVIDLQNQLGSNSLYELLEKAGVVLNGLKADYGLSIAVGGVDLTLLELTKLYTIFSNSGIYKYNNEKLISKEASYLISEILATGYRNKFSGYWQSSIYTKKIAFKTGTSSDARHLYAIGYTPNHTIGLWFGNFDNRKTKGDISGINTVLDSLIQIFEKIKEKNSWFDKPRTISTKKVCTDYYNNDNCSNLVDDLTYKAESKCMQLNTQKLEYLNKVKKIPIKDIIKNSCYSNIDDSFKPSILSPINQETYIFNKAIPKDLRVLKIYCQYSKDGSVTLYLNDKIIKNNLYLEVSEGSYNLVCMQDYDKYDEINFDVKITQ